MRLSCVANKLTEGRSLYLLRAYISTFPSDNFAGR